MAAHIKTPDPLSETGNVTLNWRIWKGQFMSFMKLTGYIKEPMNVRVEHLKNQIGTFGLITIEKLTFDKLTDKNDMDVVLQKLDAHFNLTNEVVERYNFFSSSWGNNETLEKYIPQLIEKAKTCNFGKLRNNMVIDKIILDLKDDSLRKKYFETENLNLTKMTVMYNEHNKKKQAPENKNTFHEKGQDVNKAEEHLVKRTPQSFQKPKNVCWRCKEHHAIKQCPAWGSRCGVCQELHHRTGCCKNIYLRNKEINVSNAPVKTDMERNSNVENNSFKNNLVTKNLADKNFDYRHIDSVKSTNTIPSAPEISDMDNTLYPNLNRMKDAVKKGNLDTSMWENQRNIVVDESFQQKSHPPALNMKPPPLQAPPKNNLVQPFNHPIQTIAHTSPWEVKERLLEQRTFKYPPPGYPGIASPQEQKKHMPHAYPTTVETGLQYSSSVYKPKKKSDSNDKCAMF